MRKEVIIGLMKAIPFLPTFMFVIIWCLKKFGKDKKFLN